VLELRSEGLGMKSEKLAELKRSMEDLLLNAYSEGVKDGRTHAIAECKAKLLKLKISGELIYVGKKEAQA